MKAATAERPAPNAQPILGLRARKQTWTRDAIWDAAIDLFAEKGFDEVTIDEIAASARVARRSFFRYFASKNDLMARPIADVTAGIAKALESCPTSASPGQTLDHVVVTLARESAADPRNAKVMKLVQKKGSRWKLTPDMRLSYAFDDREQKDRLPAARRRLQEVVDCLV